MFFETRGGAIYPVSAIRRIERGAWKDGDFVGRREDGRVFLSEEGSRLVHDEEIDAILRLSHPVISAPPGYSVLEFYHEGKPDEEPWVSELDIIAWRVDEENTAHPIVTDREYDRFTGVHAIRSPSGAVTDFFGSRFEDQKAWEKDQRETSEKEYAIRQADGEKNKTEG